MDTNIIYNIDCVAGMNQMIDEASIDLIIADPPYFKVIGEKWDYLWRTEEDYLEWSEKWIAEAARVLRMGGSFYLFVLDPFMGGGSTALACINNKRNYIGFEIEQEYYEKSLERLACRQMALL